MSGTRNLVQQRVQQSRSDSYFPGGSALVCCIGVPLFVLLYVQHSQPPAQRPMTIVESVKPLNALGEQGQLVPPAQIAPAAHVDLVEPVASINTPAASSVGTIGVAEHESSQALAVLNRERKRAGGYEFDHAFKVYRPPEGAVNPGGDLDDPNTLGVAVKAAAADGEIMLLCIGGSGSMRTGMNLVYNFRAMGLYHMLILAPERKVCVELWSSLPSLACVYWPSQFTKKIPNSLYNTMFSRYALTFFETRKRLVETLVVKHGLNLLHLDADTIWFANPYPLFKTLYKDYSLIIQTDNPFVNAGIMYVQNARDGDAAAWVLEELNRRIARFTYDPGSVRQLPNSAWSTPPHFANADEQANLNDIVTTALIGKPTFSNGVEFYEARFKRDRGDAKARELMNNGRWIYQMQQADVSVARRGLHRLSPKQRFEPLVHLCKPQLWVDVNTVELAIPANASAPKRQLLLAPEWLFSHFPYGDFFPSWRECHAEKWGYAARSALEQRLCNPAFRVPVVMVHMAGLRCGQWGRRGVMRALGVWHESADSVASSDWVSVRSPKLLVVEGPFVGRFGKMADFDRFAARLLLLATLLGRRAVLPSMPCLQRWAQAAMEPRHLRGLEVGCGKHKQCVWLPMPHFKEAWCNGVDFLYSIDYEGALHAHAQPHTAARAAPVCALSALVEHCGGMVDSGEIQRSRDEVTLRAAELKLDYTEGEAAILTASGAPLPSERVLRLTGGDSGDPLDWIELQAFGNKRWSAGLPQLVGKALTGSRLGLNLGQAQMTIMSDCMHSLATSRD